MRPHLRWSAERAVTVPSARAAIDDASYAGGVFFLFGFGIKQQDLGPGQVRTCPNCGNTSQWARVREFRQLTVFFVPVARWRRRHLEVCGICGTAVEV